MSKTLVTTLVAVFGLTTLAGCHHHSREPVYTPVVDTPPPVQEPTHSRKWR
jgi:predicted small lipoprotein YifL